ncbi:MAG: hypothetical protein ABIH21_00310 [Patescibacteria group bacterium]
MKKFLQGPLPDHARNLMQRFGYGEIRTRRGQISFSKRITGSQFPRYHVYIEDINGGLQINLHLDQKPNTLGAGAAHGGEYEGPLVEREMERIVQGVRSLHVPQTPPSPPLASGGTESNNQKKKGFWGKIFG